MNTESISSNPLEPTTRALQQLSPSSQEAVIALVKQFAQREGIDVPSAQAPGLQSPIEGVPLWVAKLKAERHVAERGRLISKTFLYRANTCPNTGSPGL